MSTRSHERRGEVSASELAEMGFCEKQILLAHLHGNRATAEQREAMKRGRLAHYRYFEQGNPARIQLSGLSRQLLAPFRFAIWIWRIVLAWWRGGST